MPALGPLVPSLRGRQYDHSARTAEAWSECGRVFAGPERAARVTTESRQGDRDGVMPVLRRAPARHRRRPRHVAALRELPAVRPAQRDGALLPAPRLRLPQLLARAARAVRQRRAHLHRVRLLLVVRRQLGAARPRLHREDDRPLRLRPDEPGDRAGQQRRLPPPVVRQGRRPGPRHRAGGQRGRGRRGEGRADPGALLRRRAGRASWRPRAATPTSSSATTCSPRCRTSTTSSPA